MFVDLLQHDHERSGFSVNEAPRRLGVSPAAYCALEAGERCSRAYEALAVRGATVRTS
jgi:hypothetical protein